MVVPEAPIAKDTQFLRMKRGRAALDTLIRSLPDDRLTAPGPDGRWSIKDHLAHLTIWTAGIVAMLHREPRFEAMGLDLDFVAESTTGEINARLEEK